MPTRLTIPERQQFGVGAFESFNAFHGFAALRWAWPTAFSPIWPNIDAALGGLTTGGPGVVAVPDLLTGGIITLTGQQALANVTKGLTHTQHAAASQYVQRAFVLDGIGAAVERVAADVLDTRKDSARRSKPKVILRFVRPNVKAQLAPLAKRTAAAEARATAAEHRADALAHQVATLRRQVHHAEGVALPGLEGDVIDIRQGLQGIWGKLRKFDKRLGLAALAAALIAALAKVGVNYIRCSNAKRFGKSICGMDSNILNGILAGSALIVGSVSIVEFARFMLSIEEKTLGELQKGIREVKGIKPLHFTGYTGTLG